MAKYVIPWYCVYTKNVDSWLISHCPSILNYKGFSTNDCGTVVWFLPSSVQTNQAIRIYKTKSCLNHADILNPFEIFAHKPGRNRRR